MNRVKSAGYNRQLGCACLELSNYVLSQQNEAKQIHSNTLNIKKSAN